MFLAGAIFLFTLVLVIWQPKGLSIGWSATIGAALALASGVIHVNDIPVVWNIVWNATATFIAVIVISLLLDESGFFEWAALHVARWGNGRGRLLFTWIVLLLLLVGFFVLEPLGIPVSAIATTGALILFAVAKRGHAINTGKVLRGAPWQIVIFSLGMYLVVYGLRNAGLTESLSGVLDRLAGHGLWATTLGTGFITAFLSSIMNNMPTVLIGALSIEGSAATGLIKEAMIYANVIGCDLGPKITPIGSLATLLWLHVLAQKNMTITWGYYFRTGIIMTLPVLFVTLAALALRLSFTL